MLTHRLISPEEELSGFLSTAFMIRWMYADISDLDISSISVLVNPFLTNTKTACLKSFSPTSRSSTFFLNLVRPLELLQGQCRINR